MWDELAREFQDGDVLLKELKAAVCIQRAFRKYQATYYVRANDSLQWISIRHGVSVEDLKRWNKLNSDLIQPGQVLVVQDPAAPSSSQTGAIPESIVQERRNYYESLANP